ncbi:hypothetical protein NLI96_g12663 [Meripilus lineatus]|uniref:protein S-acyltransferase n=1 Tax=Meripilus lineatus TaxID=2056292 RepID=A0AAD5YC65_9APHY|nr:hypothetical protein NLI96_g12663 [Physisporinus lineatus]
MDDPTGIVSPKGLPSASSVNPEPASRAQLSFSQAITTVHEPDLNIFVAAQRGDLQTITELIESGKAKATDRDDQNITPLHWAAINAQVAACRYLLEQGAEVDALGGDLVATPMQWAARNGYLYVIQLLIAHNADPTIADAQGYNTLHLVTHSSSVMPLLYLLHQPINVDSRDSQGHTSLMWAAYQGDALSVDLLLKHGASPNTKDDAGLTPLHWAVVRGNRVCIRRLIECGADIAAKDGEGRTARDMAVELKSLGAWKRALEEGGLNEEGIRKKKPLSERNTKIAIFSMPTLFLFLMFMTLTILPWYTGLILAMALFFAMHHVVSRVLLDRANYTDSVTSSPYFAGIIAASMVWVGYAWISRLVHQTESHAFTHLLFALTFITCAYNFFRSISLDPGTCPKPSSDAELKSGPDSHYVLHTNVHADFSSIELPTNPGSVSPSCVLPTNLCQITNYDTFLVVVAAWSTLQLFWTIPLLITQFWQVARQMTSFEVTNLGRYGFMGGRGGGVGIGAQMGQHAQLLGSHRHPPAMDDTGSPDGLSSGPGHRHVHAHGACGGFMMNILGFDRFTKGKAADGLARAGKAPNPFDLGLMGNCKDFWTRGRELGVEYERLYDVPVDGFVEAKRRRVVEEGDDSHSIVSGVEGSGREAGRKSLRKTLLMGLGIGRGGSSRGGYEPLSQV